MRSCLKKKMQQYSAQHWVTAALRERVQYPWVFPRPSFSFYVLCCETLLPLCFLSGSHYMKDLFWGVQRFGPRVQVHFMFLIHAWRDSWGFRTKSCPGIQLEFLLRQILSSFHRFLQLYCISGRAILLTCLHQDHLEHHWTPWPPPTPTWASDTQCDTRHFTPLPIWP